MNEIDYEEGNLRSSLNRYEVIKKLSLPDLEHSDSVRRQHAQMILDSTEKLEKMTRIELGEPIEEVYTQLRVGGNK